MPIMTPTWKSLLSRLRPTVLARHPRTAVQRRGRHSLSVERLEDRVVPAFILRLEEAGFASRTIVDNQPGDGDANLGSILFNGSYGTFNINSTAGISKPAVGSPDMAAIDLNTFNTSSSTG